MHDAWRVQTPLCSYKRQTNRGMNMAKAFAVWYYFLVVLPLAFEALAGPILLKQRGWRVFAPVLLVLWLAPVLIMHYVVAVPEIFIWVLPINEQTLNPALEALLCYALPIWGGAASIAVAASLKRGVLVQSVICVVVSAVLMQIVSPQIFSKILLLFIGK